jgi:hypothetical protein
MADAAENTDRELFREIEGDYYSPSLHVTKDGHIGINVGGLVIVKTLIEWHALAQPSAKEVAHKLAEQFRRNKQFTGQQ